jgi:hypothetical protein
VLDQLLEILDLLEARAAPDAIDRLEAAGRDEPRARIFRDALDGPLLERGAEGVVQRFFRDVEVAEQPYEGREDAPRLGAVHGVDSG